MLQDLLDGPPTIHADIHPCVWVVAFHEPGRRFTCLPDGKPLDFRCDDDGALHAEIHDLRTFAMLAAHYTDTARFTT